MMSLPLKGKKIIVTREKSQAKYFSDKIMEYGGKPIVVPLLTIESDDRPENQQILKKIEQYKWLIFTSANGVVCFFQLAEKYGVTMEQIQARKIAVVGEKTNRKLKEYGISADFVPSIYNADTLSEQFLSIEKNPEAILLIRGNLARAILPRELSKANIPYDSMYVYNTGYNFASKDLLNEVIQLPYDFITFTSPSSIDAYFAMTEQSIQQPCVCIGTTTEDRAKEMGIKQLITPEVFTVDAMVDCMIDYLSEKEQI